MALEHDTNVSEDSVVSFMLNESVKGRFARVENSLNNILSQHKYPQKISSLMAEAILLAIMIGQAVKLRWKLSLQIRGSGFIKLIAVDYFSPKNENSSAKVRAYATFDSHSVDLTTEPAFKLLGDGFFAVLIDQGSGTEPYQGITPLTGDSLAHCAETYFSQSEQLPTTFKIIVGQTDILEKEAKWMAGGIMLQQLPSVKQFANFDDTKLTKPTFKKINSQHDLVTEEIETWHRTKILMNTVEELELTGPYVTPEVVLHRLFHQEGLKILKSVVLRFGCSCSAKKVSKALSIYSAKDIKSMMTTDGNVTADCQFCGKHYVLDPNRLGFEAVCE